MTSLLLALALLLGEEQILTAPVRGPSAYNYGPSVAASSTNFLAAWLVWPDRSKPGRIAVLPFNEAGAEAAAPILLDESFGAPGVASNGDDYLVAWCVDGAITTRRLAKDGTPLGDAQTITPSISLGGKPFSVRTRVVWDGTHYIVAAQAGAIAGGNLGKSSVEVAVVGTDRRMTFDDVLEDAAAIPGLTLVISLNYHTPITGEYTYGRFLAADGAVGGPFAIKENVGGYLKNASGDGASFWLSWLSGNSFLYVAHMDMTGTLSQPARIATGVTTGLPPSVWNGRELVVAFATSSATKIARVPNAGDAEVLDVGPAADTLAMASANGAEALAMSNSFLLGRLIRGNEVRAIDLTTTVLDQRAPRVAGGALYYLEGTGDLTPRLVRQTAAGREVIANTVGYDADETAAAWVDGRGNGVIALFAPRLVRSFQAETVAIASNGSGHLLAFRRGTAVWMTHVAADGRLLDEVQVSSGRAVPTDIRVVWRGNDYVIEWQDGSLVKSALASTRHDDITVPRPDDAVCVTLPPGGVVHGIAGGGGRTAIVWSAPSELHQGFADPEAPSPGATIVRETISAAAVFATPAGFETAWLTQDDPLPPGDVTWASPQVVVYSKGSVIAQRTMSRTRRRAAAY